MKIVHNLKELNKALSNKKAKQVQFKPERVKSFDVQALKKAADSEKEFFIDLSELANAERKEKSFLLRNYFLLFKTAKRARLKIEVRGTAAEEERKFFAEFLGGKK